MAESNQKVYAVFVRPARELETSELEMVAGGAGCYVCGGGGSIDPNG